MMTLKKTKNLTTPSPIRKRKEKRSEIVAKTESEGKKLSQTLLKWLELEKNAQNEKNHGALKTSIAEN